MLQISAKIRIIECERSGSGLDSLADSPGIKRDSPGIKCDSGRIKLILRESRLVHSGFKLVLSGSRLVFSGFKLVLFGSDAAFMPISLDFRYILPKKRPAR